MTTITEEIAAAEVSKAWFDLVEKDDRNSPEEYPDMCLITREELAGYLTAALSKLPPAPDGWCQTAITVLSAAKKNIDPVVQYRLIAAIDELLAASPPDRNAVIEEWQPIETAPDDGQSFLAINSFGEQWICTRAAGRIIGVGQATCGMAAFVAEYATHWLPLPAPPAIRALKINPGNAA